MRSTVVVVLLAIVSSGVLLYAASSGRRLNASREDASTKPIAIESSDALPASPLREAMPARSGQSREEPAREALSESGKAANAAVAGQAVLAPRVETSRQTVPDNGMPTARRAPGERPARSPIARPQTDVAPQTYRPPSPCTASVAALALCNAGAAPAPDAR
jgi:hypothetical protein